jgi:hypothetical protein
MQSRCFGFLIIVCLSLSFMGWGQNQPPPPDSAPPVQTAPPPSHPGNNGGDFSDVTHPDRKNVVPKDTIIVKGAWYSASDTTTPLPEGGNVAKSVFSDPYFGITWTLPANWEQKYHGPPPSDTGLYVLAQLTPLPGKSNDHEQGIGKGVISGHMEIMAHDMFFTPLPAKNALQMVNNASSHLQKDVYQLEMKPTQVKIGGLPFAFYAYWSPVAELHWYILATEIRCHTLQVVMVSRDTKLLESLMGDLNTMRLPAEASPTGGTGGGPFPVCIKDYASGDNIIERVNPVFPMRRYNAIPVRIIIGKDGRIKHVHILTAFAEQEKPIYDALKQWKFRPYEQDGKPVEVETGIIFGAVPRLPTVTAADSAKTD